jgi:hypothetical protein
MSQHLRGLRRQRDRGRKRVALVTTGGAAGAAALATLFGAVLWTGQSAKAGPPAESTPRSQPAPVVQQAQPAQPGPSAATGGAARSADKIVDAADVAPTVTGSSTPSRLRAPVSQPKNTRKERPHASSGGS